MRALELASSLFAHAVAGGRCGQVARREHVRPPHLVVVERVGHQGRGVDDGVRATEQVSELRGPTDVGGTHSLAVAAQVDAEDLEGEGGPEKYLRGVAGILVPGGFGDRGIEGKIAAARYARESGTPYLGICLGYQILFDSSEESPGVRGLGHWHGKVTRFQDAPGRKVPHMGWNSLKWGTQDKIFSGIPEGAHVFFVHSFYPAPTDQTLVTAWCDYGVQFAAAAARGRVHGMQFHPEKSQDVGLRILENFVRGLHGDK